MEMNMDMEKESHAAVPPTFKTPPIAMSGEAEANEAERFNKSLRELKDLRSQLHHAADHCETAFLKAEHKQKVLENTKSYICEAIVTVIDHLGTVSANMEHKMLKQVEISQTEQKIDCLKQRLLTCQQYSLSFDFSTLQLSVKFPRHHRHYVSALMQPPGMALEGVRDHGNDSNTETMQKIKESVLEDLPAVGECVNLRTPNTLLSSGVNLATAAPVVEGMSILSKPSKHSLNSQQCRSEQRDQVGHHRELRPVAVDTCLLGDFSRTKQPVQENNFLSFLRRSRKR